jgi:hypothetical protein
LKQVGELFDPNISYGGAELEFHARLAKKGALLLFFPSLTVHHAPEIKNGSQLVEKAYKQAITTVQFAIQDSQGNPPTRAYQSLRNVWALKHAKTVQDLDRICGLMMDYDRAYNMVTKNQARSLSQLRRKLFVGKIAEAIGRAEK